MAFLVFPHVEDNFFKCSMMKFFVCRVLQIDTRKNSSKASASVTHVHFISDESFSSLFGKLPLNTGHSSSCFLQNFGPFNHLGLMAPSAV